MVNWRSRKTITASALAAVIVVAGFAFVLAQRRETTPAVRPRRVNTASPAPSHRVLRQGDDLQAALDAARPGDTITLAAGATFVGPFTLPVKGGESFVTVQSSALAELPGEGARVSPAHARLMPKLVAPGRNEPALRTAAGAHHFRFVGVEFKPADARAAVVNLVELGDDGSRGQDTLAEVPHHLVFDRCYIHGDPAGTLRRGVALNSAHTEIVNSHVSESKGKGMDTQAVCGWNGPGPFKLVNNYLEGAGENVMFGGGDPRIRDLVPSDIEIRGNHLRKPPEWRGVWTVKNLLELKNARRVVVEGNLLENNWTDGQDGTAVLFTVRNQDGTAPWSTIEDVEFTNNVLRHTGSAFNLLGRDNNQTSRQAARIRVVNNLFEDVDGERWGGRGAFLLITETAQVEIIHNTILQRGHAVLAYGLPNPGFVFRDNVVMHNDGGVFGDGLGSGAPALAKYFPGAIFAGNLLVGGEGRAVYPPRNFLPPSLRAVGFMDAEGGDYRLAPGSPFKRRATDGTDPGARVGELQAALKAAAGSQPAPQP